MIVSSSFESISGENLAGVGDGRGLAVGQPASELNLDPRFTFANERTCLAWSRTALALVVAGLGIVQLLPPFRGVPGAGACSACR